MSEIEDFPDGAIEESLRHEIFIKRAEENRQAFLNYKPVPYYGTEGRLPRRPEHEKGGY